jgi:hypothetical protein
MATIGFGVADFKGHTPTPWLARQSMFQSQPLQAARASPARSALKPCAPERFSTSEETLNRAGKGFFRRRASKFSDMSENLDNKKGKSRRKTKGSLPPTLLPFYSTPLS